MSEEVQLTFDKRLYSVDDVQKAAYRGAAALTVDLALNESHIVCSITPNIDASNDDFIRAVEDFKKDVVDYHLRAKIKKESEPLRNLILGIAFSRTGLQGNE